MKTKKVLPVFASLFAAAPSAQALWRKACGESISESIPISGEIGWMGFFGKTLCALSFVCLGSTANAQVIEYQGCVVEDAQTFSNILNGYYEAMADGYRPIMALDRVLWHGERPETHYYFQLHGDFEALSGFMDRRRNSARAQELIAGISDVADCGIRGLLILRGFYGVQEDMQYQAPYEISASDRQEYAEAFPRLAEAMLEGVSDPISIGLYENRAGLEGVTHFVVFEAPSLAELNRFIDGLAQNAGYAAQVENLAGIRSLGADSQRRRLRVWTNQ